VGSFLRYRHLESKSENLESYEVLLRAFDRIDDLLEPLSDSLQVYRGVGALQLQPPVAEEGIEPAAPSTLDYLVRTGDIELQIDVLLPPANEFSLPRKTIQQYARVMVGSPRTRAIIVVWATEQLNSVVFEVGQIRQWLKAKEERLSISLEDLPPLEESLQLVLRKCEPVFWCEEELHERRRAEFDLLEAFRDCLMGDYRQLVESASGKRIQERRLAIESITQSEIASLADLATQCIDERLTWEKLREAIADISQEVRIR